MTDWVNLAAWWLDELAADPAYRDVEGLLFDLVDSKAGERWLDLGCGEGRTMRRLRSAGVRVIGCDVNLDLLTAARSAGPVVQCRLPAFDWARSETFDGAYAILVLEHLSDLDLFAQARRVVAPGGTFAVVMNHPLYTAPEAAPVVDPTDGELFWRWGRYLKPEDTVDPASGVVFHHRPLSGVLNAAAEAGWSLERLVERPIIKPELAGQDNIPRLLGARWRKQL